MTRECPTVNSCCFFFPLKIGGVIVGVLDIILLLFLTSMDIKDLIEGPPDQKPDANQNVNQTTNETVFQPQPNLISHEGDLILFIVLNCIFIFVALCWFYGIYKERPYFMLPTVIISLARFMYMAITLVFSNSILGAISAFFGTPYVAFAVQILCFYCWIVENSLYKKVRSTVKRRNQPQTLMRMDLRVNE